MCTESFLRFFIIRIYIFNTQSCSVEKENGKKKKREEKGEKKGREEGGRRGKNERKNKQEKGRIPCSESFSE